MQKGRAYDIDVYSDVFTLTVPGVDKISEGNEITIIYKNIKVSFVVTIFFFWCNNYPLGIVNVKIRKSCEAFSVTFCAPHTIFFQFDFELTDPLICLFLSFCKILRKCPVKPLRWRAAFRSYILNSTLNVIPELVSTPSYHC